MTQQTFDQVARRLATGFSRRGLWQAAAGAALGVAAARLPIAARARNKKRKKKITRNRFGCVNVGSFCKNAGQCCSGICQGKKPKKGQKDKRVCVAHDEGSCQAGQKRTVCGGADVPCTTDSGGTGRCETTTGNAGYCEVTGSCFPCQRDTDCQQFCGPQAACVVCAEGCSPGTACVGPDVCVFP